MLWTPPRRLLTTKRGSICLFLSIAAMRVSCCSSWVIDVLDLDSDLLSISLNLEWVLFSLFSIVSDWDSYLIFATLALLIWCCWICKLRLLVMIRCRLILFSRYRHLVAFQDSFQCVVFFLLLKTLVDLMLQVQNELPILTILKFLFIVPAYY